MNIEKGINFSFKELTNKQLNKLVKQSEIELENDILKKIDIFPGDKVVIRILPIEKSILKARYEGPYEVKKIKGVVVVQNRFGRQLIRNKRHVKRIRYSPTQKEKTELKYRYQKNSMSGPSVSYTHLTLPTIYSV